MGRVAYGLLVSATLLVSGGTVSAHGMHGEAVSTAVHTGTHLAQSVLVIALGVAIVGAGYLARRLDARR